MKNDSLTKPIIEQMMKDRTLRSAITRESHYWFFNLYFNHYVKHETAPFQREIFKLTEEQAHKNIFLCAFRGSGKSTLMTLSYALWSILGIQQKKFVLLLFQTINQAKQHMANLKQELEDNSLLKNDLGPFREESDEWGAFTLVFPEQNARITVASTEQSIRGMRHHQYRPDLIICDDVEDLASTKTREGREKTYRWLKSDVIPAGDQHTRLIVIGNLLHEDSLLMHLKRDLEEGITNGIFRSYPLLDDNGNCLWQGKYPTYTEIEMERKRLGNENAWQREFLLRIIPEEDQIILQEWIQYYEHDELSPKKCRAAYIAVDPAISQKDSADFTAVAVVVIEGYGKNFYARVLSHPINRKMRFPETVTLIESLYSSLKSTYPYLKILVEDVAYQKSLIDQLENHRYPVIGIKPLGDKYSRLVTASNLIQTGKILFPKRGAEELIQQMIGFGVERHDDLVDALTLAAQKIIEEDKPSIHFRDFYSPEELREISRIAKNSEPVGFGDIMNKKF